MLVFVEIGVQGCYLITTEETLTVKKVVQVFKAIPINCFVSHRPTDQLFFKLPLKENITDPYFWKFQ